jgi:hypothetical protein
LHSVTEGPEAPLYWEPARQKKKEANMKENSKNKATSKPRIKIRTAIKAGAAHIVVGDS